jgi:hypothetical protein
MFGTTTLHIDSSWRAFCFPTVSIFQAAYCVSNLDCRISMREVATHS